MSPSSRLAAMARLRAAILACGLVLAGCSGSDDTPAFDEPTAEPENMISCAIGTASEFTTNCSVERQVEDGVLFLTLNHEDGSFRRLRVMDDGSGVVAADGADEALITVFDGEIEVSLGGDRYLLPATITGNAAK